MWIFSPGEIDVKRIHGSVVSKPQMKIWINVSFLISGLGLQHAFEKRLKYVLYKILTGALEEKSSKIFIF